MGDMDHFTQKCLESAQKRSKKLGISNMSKVPLTESNVSATPTRQQSMKSKTVSPKRRASNERKPSTAASPNFKNRAVALRTVQDIANPINIEAKENVDLALEINITTGPNVQIQVEVEEHEIDGDGNVLNSIQKQRKQMTVTSTEPIESNSAPSSCIRDSSRNQLHRLGALYSNPQDLSSPVHRTETAFSIEQDHASRSNTKLKKSNRLAELTSTINAWEDESFNKLRPNKSTDNDCGGGSSAAPTIVASTSKATDMKMVSGIKPITKSPRKCTANGATATGSILNRIESFEKKENDYNKNSNNKQLKWDKSIMDSLESQGYKRRDTTTKRLEYDFKDQSDGHAINKKFSNADPINKGNVAKANAKQPESMAAKKAEVIKGLVSGRAAIFETPASRTAANSSTTGATSKNQKDPAEMTLKERMALFEKNKGEALIPKAALGMAPSVKQIMADKKPSENVKQVITTPQQPMISSHSVNMVAPSASKINNFNKTTKADTCASGSGIRQTVAALLTAPATISESRIANENRKIREQEMNVVLNRFNQQHNEPASPPPAPPMPDNLFKQNSGGRKKRSSDEHLGVSADVRKSLETVKRVKVNPPKSGHAYPALTDIESSGAEGNTPISTPEPAYTDDDNEQPIMDRYYMYQSKNDHYDDGRMDSEEDMSSESEQNDRSTRHQVHFFDSTTSSESNDMDKYLDEAIEYEDYDEDNDHYNHGHQKLQKGSISSNSFSYERKPLNRQQDTIFEEEATATNYQTSKFQSPIKSRLTVNPSDDNNSVTLTHTVSFYRKQQTNFNSPAPRKANPLHMPNDLTAIDDNTDYDDDEDKTAQTNLVDAKIKSLKDTIMIQNQQIAQASNALTTCASTFEFSGSTESVVAEWKLLVATHSRKAALQEIERLQVERCLRPADAPKECGRLTVKDIVLPLREDYVKKVSEEKISGHHLVCLLKYNEHVLATRTIPTLPGLLAVKFPGELHLDNVYADFKITLEIYGMIAQRESLPHDIKYHIKKEKKGIIKTPKGKKAGSNLIFPPAQSPAGPNAVRAPAFAYYGFVIFSLREVQRNTWTLNQVAARDITPLVGTVHMKINCALSVNIDHKAFLTMFEDVSGFGAWHRRWCRLHGSILSYWKYPDDERTKPPIGSLDLSACEQTKISTAPRDMCARLNTLMIELKRPRREEDEDSMLLQTQGQYSYVRHLLSADTKEERDEWCANFNKTLALMRAWGNSQRQSKN